MRRAGAGFGAATLVMIFSVLCLTIFAVLSLRAAREELRLSQRYAESTEAYYSADARATEILSRLRSARDINAELDALREAGVEADIYGGVVSYAVDAGNGLRLQVRLDVFDHLAILSWATERGEDWQADESLDVWDGD